MFKTILVPLDGSDFAEAALPLAVDLARRAEAEIHLVRVHEVRGLPYYEALSEPDPEEDARIRALEEDALRKVAKRLEDDGIAAKVALLDGPLVGAIADYVEEESIGLVVMTTHGRGGLSRAWLGSVADGLVRNSVAPVMLVRPGETRVPEDVRFGEILVPLDGSAVAERALRPAVRLANLTDSKLTLLQVYVYGVPFGAAAALSASTEVDISPTTRYLEQVADELRTQGLEVETAVMTHELPGPAILDFAEKRRVGMIAMATHGRGGWSRIALGSVADKVMRGASAPVLIQRVAE